MQKNIIVAAEYSDSRVKPITFELIRFAREVAMFTGQQVKVVLTGVDPESPAYEIAEKEGLDVVAIRFSGAGAPTVEVVLSALEQVLPAMNPSFVIFGHTSTGLDMAPALAAGIDASCITGVNGMAQGDSLAFSRSICNGKFNAEMTADAPCILTLLPGVFSQPFEVSPHPVAGNVEVATLFAAQEKIIFRGVVKQLSEESTLTQAKIVIAAGRGIEKEANLGKIYAFSKLFPASSVAGSRPLIDMGWLPYKQQVGITGAIVSPEIYIACGISGSSQHLAGMDKSAFVVAINNDPNATIFNHADLCIVEDLFSFIDTLRMIAV